MSPRFSFITPVYNTPEDVLIECIGSVQAQWFSDWELCLVNDGSTATHVRTLLDTFADDDPRINVHHRTANGGIVAASNDALEIARGDFIVLLDHDDTIEPDTLHLVNEALDTDEQIDLAYSDADKLDAYGNAIHPFHKPDWSPERFRHQNYLIHIAVARRSIVAEVGGFRPGFDGAQDYDLLLRVSERARTIHHIPRVLYHWRIIPGSTAGDSQAKPAAYEAGRRAIEDHCGRVGLDATVEALAQHPGSYRVHRRLSTQPKVSIVIPTAGATRRLWGVHVNLPVNAISRTAQATSYPDVEWVLVHDAGCSPATLTEVRSVCPGPMIEVPQAVGFNFSDAVNRGVQASTGQIIVLLNDDVEVLTPDWLEQFISMLEDDTVGSVGPKLLLPNLRVQSAGHWHGETPDHLGRDLDRADPGPFSALQVARECSSLTGACVATRRSTWEQVGGMTTSLPNAYNDADFGNKLRSIDLRNVYIPWVEAIHHETSTRDPHVPRVQLDEYTRRWSPRFRTDNYARYGWG
jgi:glycosyltransferase involved in cell wall biosynthesis